MTDESKDKGGITIRLPDKAVIAIVLALAGFAWNKVDAFLTRATQHKVEEGIFEFQQGQITELVRRVDDLRAAIELLESSPKHGSTPPASIAKPSFPEPPPPVRSKIKYEDFVNQVQRKGVVDIEEIEEEAAESQ